MTENTLGLRRGYIPPHLRMDNDYGLDRTPTGPNRIYGKPASAIDRQPQATPTPSSDFIEPVLESDTVIEGMVAAK